MKRRCYFCGSTNLARRIVDEPIFDGDELVGSVRVVAYVCLQCGESYLPHQFNEARMERARAIERSQNC